MAPLRQQMITAMQIHGFSPRTHESYLAAVRDLAAYSTPKWTPIPRQTGHSVQRKLDSDSSANWTPVPRQTGPLKERDGTRDNRAPWGFPPEVRFVNRRLSMHKIEDVLRLHHECGRSNREIARAVRVSPCHFQKSSAPVCWAQGPLCRGLMTRAAQKWLLRRSGTENRVKRSVVLVIIDVEGFSWRFWLVAQTGQDGYTELDQP